MPAVDFAAWASPTLDIELGGRTYVVRPPSVDAAPPVLALAIRFRFGAERTPQECNDIIAAIPKRSHPALGDAYDTLVADGWDQGTIDRVAIYATLHWAYGPTAADAWAHLLWGEGSLTDESAAEPADAAPKA